MQRALRREASYRSSEHTYAICYRLLAADEEQSEAGVTLRLGVYSKSRLQKIRAREKHGGGEARRVRRSRLQYPSASGNLSLMESTARTSPREVFALKK